MDRIDDVLDYQDSCNSETAEEQNASDEAIQVSSRVQHEMMTFGKR